jgi:hypothetical protein
MAEKILLPTDHPVDGIEKELTADDLAAKAAHEAAITAAKALAVAAVPTGLTPEEYLEAGNYKVLVPQIKAELRSQGHYLNSSKIAQVLDAEAVRRGVAGRPIYTPGDDIGPEVIEK